MFTVHVHMHTMYVHIVLVDKTGYPKLLACKTWQETLKKTSPSECAATTPACLTVTVVWCSPATRLDGSRGICVVAVVVDAGLDQVARLEMKKIAMGGMVAWLVDLWKDVSRDMGLSLGIWFCVQDARFGKTRILNISRLHPRSSMLKDFSRYTFVTGVTVDVPPYWRHESRHRVGFWFPSLLFVCHLHVLNTAPWLQWKG